MPPAAKSQVAFSSEREKGCAVKPQLRVERDVIPEEFPCRAAPTIMKIGVQRFTVAMLKHCTPAYFRGKFCSSLLRERNVPYLRMPEGITTKVSFDRMQAKIQNFISKVNAKALQVGTCILAFGIINYNSAHGKI
jgi:hypothetical protein